MLLDEIVESVQRELIFDHAAKRRGETRGQGFQILCEHFAQIHDLIVGEQDVALAGHLRQILQVIPQPLCVFRPDVVTVTAALAQRLQ